MTFKYLLSRIVTLFSIILLTATVEATSGHKAMAQAYLAFYFVIIFTVIAFGILIRIFFSILTYYKKVERYFATLQCFIVLLVSYLLSFLIIWKHYPPVYIYPLSRLDPVQVIRPLETSLLLVYGLAVLLQIFAWILLFRKDGWRLVLRLSIVSIFYPIIYVLVFFLLSYILGYLF